MRVVYLTGPGNNLSNFTGQQETRKRYVGLKNHPYSLNHHFVKSNGSGEVNFISCFECDVARDSQSLFSKKSIRRKLTAHLLNKMVTYEWGKIMIIKNKFINI